ncbi:hypothetical protein GCM10022384_28870 [Streptomyces marokkonensis]|uniref:Transposase DDE domain-containing protein n=1 Tax=Streptomyces marokkonensis TaxID=324855 RepID=A0ABP7Q674_9ACTN
MVSQAGSVLLVETVRKARLDTAISAALMPWRKPRAVHDPGKVLLGVALAVALGGDCLADVGMLRAEPTVFGPPRTRRGAGDRAFREGGRRIHVEADVRPPPTSPPPGWPWRSCRRSTGAGTSAGGIHTFLTGLTQRGRWLSYTVGMAVTEQAHSHVLKVPASA